MIDRGSVRAMEEWNRGPLRSLREDNSSRVGVGLRREKYGSMWQR